LNDLKYRSPLEVAEMLAQLFEIVGSDLPIFVLSVIPVDEQFSSSHHKNENIGELNREIRELAASTLTVEFVDINSKLANNAGGLLSSLHIGDGVHLNADGNAIVIAELRSLFR
jgi:lysophospholipase L1-like esterase